VHRLFAAFAIATVVALSLVTARSVAAAHEKRTVGPYAVEVGWLVEPAYVNSANAVFVEVVDAHSDAPVEHLDKTLQVEVIIGGAAARRTFDLQPIPLEAGHYQAPFIPTAMGDYTFRVFGTIASTKIDERFESGPGRFDPVVSTGSLQFPKTLTTADELGERIDQVRLIAIVGLLIAVAALIMPVARLLTRRR
jgi:hypothetical protein